MAPARETVHPHRARDEPYDGPAKEGERDLVLSQLRPWPASAWGKRWGNGVGKGGGARTGGGLRSFGIGLKKGDFPVRRWTGVLRRMGIAGVAAVLATASATEAQSTPKGGAVTYQTKSDAELKQVLSPIQYKVTQREGTEPPVPERVLGQPRARDLRRRGLGRAALQLARQVRLRHRLAQLHQAARAGQRRREGGPQALHDPHRGPLQARRFAPGPRLRGRPRARPGCATA